MQPPDDSVLLRQYAENQSDDAFAALVTRHINLVYSVALRCVGDPHQAEEVAQAVFILLAKKAHKLRHDKALSSWLFQAARLTANNFIRGDTRRHRREQEAHMQSVLNESGTDCWPGIAPLLDDAVAALSEKDRRAIVLRFYEGRNLREVGAAIGATEDAAEKRVSRAVERLRDFFARHGVSIGAKGLVLVISTNAVLPAPAGLSVAVTTAALAGATTATLSGAGAGPAGWFNTQSAAAMLAAALVAGLAVYFLNQRLLTRHEEAVRAATVQQQQMARARDEALGRTRASEQQVAALRREMSELPRLRIEIARLRNRLGLALRQDEPPQPTLSATELKSLLDGIDTMPFELMETRAYRIHLMHNDTNALATLRAQGTNLLPQLLQFLATEDKDVPEIPHTEESMPDNGRVRRLLASKGFFALGSSAAPAIPALLKMGVYGPDDDAAYALAGIGRAAIPSLVDALSSPDQAIRRRAMVAIGLLGPQASACSEMLIRCLGDGAETPEMRLAALFALNRTNRESEQALPVLLEAFRDSKLLGTTSRIVFTTSNAVELFSTSFEHHGPLAKSAFPGLLALLPKVKNHEIGFVQKALKAIDARAADEAGIQ